MEDRYDILESAREIERATHVIIVVPANTGADDDDYEEWPSTALLNVVVSLCTSPANAWTPFEKYLVRELYNNDHRDPHTCVYCRDSWDRCHCRVSFDSGADEFGEQAVVIFTDQHGRAS